MKPNRNIFGTGIPKKLSRVTLVEYSGNPATPRILGSSPPLPSQIPPLTGISSLDPPEPTPDEGISS